MDVCVCVYTDTLTLTMVRRPDLGIQTEVVQVLVPMSFRNFKNFF